MSTSSATVGSPRNAARRAGSRSWTPTIIVSIVGTLLAGFLGFMTTMVLGNVMGTEFCPYTFERRGYAFREIPFTGYQISTIDRRTDIGIVELHIIKMGYIVPDTTKTTPNDWHLLSLIRFRGTYAEGDAKLLMSYLDAQDNHGEWAWLKWTEDHPQLAKILWPAVATAAKDYNYLIIPDLFSHARSTNNPVELQKQVDATLAKVAKPKVATPPAEKAAPEVKSSDEKPAKKS
jgi:hypothetical protein